MFDRRTVTLRLLQAPVRVFDTLSALARGQANVAARIAANFRLSASNSRGATDGIRIEESDLCRIPMT